MVSFDDICDANGVTDGGRKVTLQRLIEINAAWPELLVDGFRYIASQRHHPTVLAYCQVPFYLNVDRGPYRMRHEEIGKEVQADFQHCKLLFDPSSLRFAVSPCSTHSEAEDAREGGATITQVRFVVPLWGPRATYYQKYLSLAQQPTIKDRIVVPASKSWHRSGGAIDVNTYEYDLAERMLREIPAIIRRFLRHYMAIALIEMPIPKQIYAYFIMTEAGRVVTAPPVLSSIDFFLSGSAMARSKKVTTESYTKAAKWVVHREFSKFERQLFAMTRLCSEGELALSLIGTMSLVEWLLKSHSGSARGKRNLVELLRNSGLPDEVLTKMDAARQVRNIIVHGEPPDRREVMRPTERSEAAEFFGQKTGLTAALVVETIEVAFEVFRFLNMTEQR